jgi:hypothetical protein
LAWVFAEIADGANMFNSTFLVNIVIHLSIDPRLIGNLENIQNRTGHGMAWHGMAWPPPRMLYTYTTATGGAQRKVSMKPEK